MADTGAERPPDDELDRMYRRLLDELNIPESKRGSMLAQPMHMKWKLLSKHQRYVRVQSSSYGSYGGAVRSVQILDRILVNADTTSKALGDSSDLVDFRVEVKPDADWVQVFLELGGVKKLIGVLDVAAARGEIRAQTDLLECLHVLAKGNGGTLSMLLDEFDAITIIAACLPSCEQITSSASSKLALLVLGILEMTGLQSHDGHLAVMHALEVLRGEKHEAMSYSSLVGFLRSDSKECDAGLKAGVIRFLNTLIRGVDKLEDRVSMRGDLAYLGILRALDDLEGMIELLMSEESEQREELDNLLAQVSSFRTFAAQDNKALISAAPTTGTWLADPDLVFAKVQDNARVAGTAKELVQILHACLVIPQNAPPLAPGVWRLLAETSQKIVANPDSSRMSFAQVEQSYLESDERFRALRNDRKRVSELELELQETKEQVLSLSKSHAEEIRRMKVQHQKELEQAQVAAAAANAQIPDKNNETKSKDPNHQNQQQLPPEPPAFGQESKSDSAAPLGKFEKYARMKKAGLPEPAIENAMTKDGLDQADQDEFFGRKKEAAQGKNITDPRFEKYSKMLKHGLPEGAVRVAMLKDGLSEADQSTFFNDGGSSNDKDSDDDDDEEESKDGEIDSSVKDDPKFARYFKMQMAHLPEGAIINAMARDSVSEEDQNRFFGRASNSKKSQKKKKNAIADKPKVQQRKPMRALFWSKLPNESVPGTLWLNLDQDNESIELDIDALESGFAQTSAKEAKQAAAISKQSNDNSEKSSTSNKNKVVELIDPNRRQNVGIAFARLKMSPQMLKTCIVEMDLRRLGGGIDRVKLLKGLIPNHEEMGLLHEYTGEKERLGKIEQLFLELGSVTNIGDMIRAWEIQLGFKQRVAETRETVETFSRACLQVKDSAALKQLLKVILAVGNYLNGTSARGGAYGFKLDLLNKIGTVKATDNKTTLLSYIVKQVVETSYPAITRLPKELEHVESAHRVSIAALLQTCKEHERDLEFLQKVVKQVNTAAAAGNAPANPEDDDNENADSTFVSKTREFLLGAQKSLGHLSNAAGAAQEAYNELLNLLTPGDEEFSASSEKFFHVLHSFIEAFKRELTPPDEKQRRKSHLQKNNSRNQESSPHAADKQPTESKGNQMSSGHSILAEIKSRKGKASLTGRASSARASSMRPVDPKPATILDQIRARAQSG